MVEEEGLEARWARHRHHHLALAAGVGAMGLSLLPPEPERLWTLNAIRVPDGVDEAAVRKQMLAQFDIEVGAGLGPLAGKIWRVGLMGASSTPAIILLFLGAFESVLRAQGAAVPRGAGTAAALDVLGEGRDRRSQKPEARSTEAEQKHSLQAAACLLASDNRQLALLASCFLLLTPPPASRLRSLSPYN